MNCQHWKPILFDLARGLNPAQSQDALGHIQKCSECAGEFEQQQELNKGLKLLAADAKREVAQNMPPVLLTAFRTMKSSTKVNHRLLTLARVAILAVAIFGGWMWFRSVGHHASPRNQDFQNATYQDEFIPLQYGNSPVNSMQVVRVELESSALQELGFPRVPEWEDRPIQADIVVGEDGLPQAIRFVNFQRQ